jgi:Domain of unknown function (DUF6265)
MMWFLLSLWLMPGQSSSQTTLTGGTSIERLTWLTGCWATTAPGSDTREQWTLAGDALIGVGRTVRGGRLVAHEFLLIQQTPKGLAYIARPSGQREATFLLESLTASRAVFGNPDHDFPQQVIYDLAGDGTLHAAVRGLQNGKERREEFPMRKIACEPQ